MRRWFLLEWSDGAPDVSRRTLDQALHKDVPMYDVQVLASKDDEPTDEAWRADVERIRTEIRRYHSGSPLGELMLDLVNHVYAHHGAALANLERDLIRACEAHEKRIDEVEAHTAGIDRGLGEVDRSLGKRIMVLEQDAPGWEGTYDRYTRRLQDTVTQQIGTISERLSKLERYDENQRGINVHQERRIEELNAWSREVNERLSKLDERYVKRPLRGPQGPVEAGSAQPGPSLRGSPEELDLLREIRFLATRAENTEMADDSTIYNQTRDALRDALNRYDKEYRP